MEMVLLEETRSKRSNTDTEPIKSDKSVFPGELRKRPAARCLQLQCSRSRGRWISVSLGPAWSTDFQDSQGNPVKEALSQEQNNSKTKLLRNKLQPR